MPLTTVYISGPRGQYATNVEAVSSHDAVRKAVAPGLQFTWFDRSGKRIGSLGEPADVNRLSFSPDRKSFTVSITDPSSHNADTSEPDRAAANL
jgi:hypothetical protein